VSDASDNYVAIVCGLDMITNSVLRSNFIMLFPRTTIWFV
jgi:hypothetical protein